MMIIVEKLRLTFKCYLTSYSEKESFIYEIIKLDDIQEIIERLKLIQ